jgi:hypothetical protein
MFSAQGSDLFIVVVYLTMLPVTQILYFFERLDGNELWIV